MFRSQGTPEISQLGVIEQTPLTLVVNSGKNAPLLWWSECLPCSHAAGPAKWPWSWNHVGNMRWEVSKSQLKEPPATS